MTDKNTAAEAPATAAARAAARDAAVDQWFYETFHGSPLARDTELYNTVQRGLANLKTRLAAAS